MIDGGQWTIGSHIYSAEPLQGFALSVVEVIYQCNQQVGWKQYMFLSHSEITNTKA